jgi:hypothetical protein
VMHGCKHAALRGSRAFRRYTFTMSFTKKKSPYPPRLLLLAPSFTSAITFILIAIGSPCRPCPQPGHVPPPPPPRRPLLLLISKAHVLAGILYTFLHHKPSEEEPQFIAYSPPHASSCSPPSAPARLLCVVHRLDNFSSWSVQVVSTWWL